MAFRQDPYAYDKFRRSVIQDFRFIHNDEVQRFLDEVFTTTKQHVAEIEEGRALWRAQLGCRTIERTIEEIGDAFDEDVPFERERMVPPYGKQRPGRVNAAGIDCLYLAREKRTALAEVRPWVGAKVSLAQFGTNRVLKLVDCTKKSGRLYWTGDDAPPEDCEKFVWSYINNAFSTPIGPKYELQAYVPTQIISEVIRSQRYDGIGYTSALNPNGLNIALFDFDAVRIVSREVYSVKSVAYEFHCVG